MFNKKTTMVRRNKNFAAYSKALLDFKYVYSWAGHNHHTYLYTSEPERNYDIDNLTSITVTKSTGALRLNRLLNNDGTPQGYFVVDVDGEGGFVVLSLLWQRSQLPDEGLSSGTHRRRIRDGQHLGAR